MVVQKKSIILFLLGNTTKLEFLHIFYWEEQEIYHLEFLKKKKKIK